MSVLVEVWGPYACFTRPEFKVERVSYDVLTPSAARGIMDAIFWHPGMHWYIDKIHVCAPIRFTNVRCNEIENVINARKVKTTMGKGEGELFLATSECIQQRASTILRDVRYVIEAHYEMDQNHASPSDSEAKFSAMIHRRIEKGQCYHQPCFGMRQFPAHFAPCTQIPPCPDELRGEKHLGRMLLDMNYCNPKDITPVFFDAVLRDGVLDVPRAEIRR